MGEGTTESPAASQDVHAHDWPLRPWLLAGLLGIAGLLIYFATKDYPETPTQAALSAFAFFGPLCAAFSLERARWKEAAIFALVAGLVMAGLAWRAVNAGDHYADEEYGFAAGVFATLLALPLFQAGFHRLRFKTPYRDVHFFAWTDAVVAAGSLAFVGATFLMLFLLAALFSLLKIELLSDLLQKEWFVWMVAGAAFGAALGLLRNQLKILHTLQWVAMLLLSVLAVPLALALIAFLLAMIVSGPAVLWEATESATPVLLACALGSFVLTNAIVRDDDTDMTRSLVMRIAAFVLALGILPLTLFAAVSMGTRIAQHGLSPERLWALVAIAVAVAYGLAALVSVIRGRLWGWRPFLRRANLELAAGLSVVALILALPILDFGAISAANQVSRLESGKVGAKEFDYSALRWDFGDAGRRALAKLAASKNANIAKLAKEAQALTERPYSYYVEPDVANKRLANLHTEIADPKLREALEAFLREQSWRCSEPCVAIDLGKWRDGTPHLGLVESGSVEHLRLEGSGKLVQSVEEASGPNIAATPTGEPPAVPKVEVRPYNGRQVYVDGRPAGMPFE